MKPARAARVAVWARAWVKAAAWGVLSLVGMDFVLGILLGASAVSVETVRLVLTSAVMMVVFGLALQALRRPAVYISTLKRYATSGVGDETLANWAQRLHAEMDGQSVYLQNDLSLQQLAARIRIKPHHLSQVLNQHIGQNFYDFINRARIRHACELLAQTDQTVLDIALASGYNNKVSFYNAFKQFIGKTPRAYRQEQGNARDDRVRVG